MSDAGPSQEWFVPWRLDLAGTVSSLRRGRGDPTMTLAAGQLWRAFRTPEGVASVSVQATDVLSETGSPAIGTALCARAYGPGAEWALASIPGLVGLLDRPKPLPDIHPVVTRAAREHPGLRLPRTGLVFESLLPSVLEQRVTGIQAHRSFRELVLRFGEAAPGPAPPGLRVAPSPAVLGALPSWDWHAVGVDGQRRTTLIRLAEVASSIERLARLPVAEAGRRLQSLPGVGPWTVAEVTARVWGDPDAVPVGDYNLPAAVGHTLIGRSLTDPEMLAVLDPFRPQRYRVLRLLELHGLSRPRRAPRLAIPDHRHR